MRLRDDFNVDSEAYLYWIKSPEMDDISSQGYVGVTRNVSYRFNQHNSALESTKRNRYYHNGLVKRFKQGVLEMVVINCGSEDDMYTFEQALRPTKALGWNYAVGGKAHGMSNRNFFIAGKGFSYSQASEILGRSCYQVYKSINSYHKTPEEALGIETTVDNKTWCNYPTNTGYIKFLFPYEDVLRYKDVIIVDFETCKNLTKIGKKYGITGATVKKILTDIHNVNLAKCKNICYNGCWFRYYTEKPEDLLYNVLDFYLRTLSATVVSVVYGLPEYFVLRLHKTFVKAGGVSPYQDVKRTQLPLRLIFDRVCSGSCYKEIAKDFNTTEDVIRCRFLTSCQVFYEEYLDIFESNNRSLEELADLYWRAAFMRRYPDDNYKFSDVLKENNIEY
jgi:hypothetical protein